MLQHEWTLRTLSLVKEANTEGQILSYSIYTKNLEKANIRVYSKVGRQSYCLVSMDFGGVIKIVWIQITITVTQHCKCI